MSDNKARQPNRAAPPVPLRNDKTIIYQRTDNTRSKQQVNEMQQHLFYDECKETQKAVWAVCNPQNYQGTWLVLISLAGCINAVTGQTFIGSTTLAKRIGVNRDTTDAELLRLQDAGIVTIHGKQGRSYKRSIMLPCSHLDIDADSSADTYADTYADSSADTYAGTHADTSPHYQDRTETEQDQQQRDPVAGHSQAEKEKFHLKINSKLPQDKRIGFTRQFKQLIDLTADPVQLGVIIRQLHTEQNSWSGGGGTISALERITQTQAATYKERQPKPVLNPCAGLDADTECDTVTHTTIGDRDAPVQLCPQKRGAT